jgi:hypothetical protein
MDNLWHRASGVLRASRADQHVRLLRDSALDVHSALVTVDNARDHLHRARPRCARRPGTTADRRPRPPPVRDLRCRAPLPHPAGDHRRPAAARPGEGGPEPFCDASPDAMRTALRRIAEIHSACRPDCPERQRLAAVHTGPSPGGTGWYGGPP